MRLQHFGHRRRGRCCPCSNPARDAGALLLSYTPFVRRPGVAPGCYLRIRQAPSLAGSRRSVRCCVGPDGLAPPSPGFRPGACAVSATDPRWNGTWVLPPLLLVGSQLCICQHLSRLETRLGVEPSETWVAATCLAVRPTRHGCEGGPRSPNLPGNGRALCLLSYLASSTATGDRTPPSGLRNQRRLQLTLAAWSGVRVPTPLQLLEGKPS